MFILSNLTHSPRQALRKCMSGQRRKMKMKDVYIPRHHSLRVCHDLVYYHTMYHACDISSAWTSWGSNYLRNALFYWKIRCFFCRVRDQTGKASHLVPETDRGLQECGDHRLDDFLEKWHRPLCPHPQIQTPADVRNTHQIIQVPACDKTPTSYLFTVFDACIHSHEQTSIHCKNELPRAPSLWQLVVMKYVSCGCVKYSRHEWHFNLCELCSLPLTSKTLDLF